MAISRIGGPDDQTVFAGDVRIEGDLALAGDTAGMNRAALAQEPLVAYPLLPESWKVHDSLDTPLPATPLADDLGVVGGTFGTDTPSLQTEDLKAAGATTSYARRSFALPAEFDAGATVVLRIHAGMLTTVADVAATVDVGVFKSDREAGVDGADLCGTAAQSINNLVLADKDFNIDGAGLAAGDLLDVRVAVAVNDSATVTAVKAILSAIEMLLDVKG